MKLQAILVIAITLLTGCATSNTKTNIPSNFSFNEQKNTGVMLASVSYSGSFSGYAVYYRKVGESGNGQKLQIGAGTAVLPPGMMDWDIEKPGLRGNVFAVELPAGEYEIFNYSLSSGFAHGSGEEPLSLRFTVEPHRATYIGNFLFRRTAGFGATVLGVNISHADFSERDLPIIHSKYASLDTSDVLAPFGGIHGSMESRSIESDSIDPEQ